LAVVYFALRAARIERPIGRAWMRTLRSQSRRERHSTASFKVRGIVVNVLSPESLIQRVESLLETGRGFAVATLNLDHLVKLRCNSRFRAAYAMHDFVTADGFPIVWAGRIAGLAVVRTTGSDLVEPLAALAAQRGWGVALIGSTEPGISAASARLSAAYPGLRICLERSPAPEFDCFGPEADRLAESVRDFGARLCFVALGAPKQEVFSARLKAVAPSVACFSIGAGIDFISGHQTRAPKIIRQMCMEWAWRLISNPRRMLVRYLNCARVFPAVLWSAIRLR
jgi:N-acetylglucosaminyldiphosphoundecaprenol N-acetyl-beta-D-mannosaminyltransferase